MIPPRARVVVPDTVTLLYRVHSGALTQGRSILDGDIALLTDILASATVDERPLIRRALRRRYAKRRLVGSYDLAAEGRIAAARWQMLRAAVTDRNVRRTPSHWGASVTVRALACFVAPRWALKYRDDTWHSSEGRVGVKGRTWPGLFARRPSP